MSCAPLDFVSASPFYFEKIYDANISDFSPPRFLFRWNVVLLIFHTSHSINLRYRGIVVDAKEDLTVTQILSKASESKKCGSYLKIIHAMFLFLIWPESIRVPISISANCTLSRQGCTRKKKNSTLYAYWLMNRIFRFWPSLSTIWIPPLYQ